MSNHLSAEEELLKRESTASLERVEHDCILSMGCVMSSHTPSRTAFKMFLIPCSCGTTFAVPENYDRQGSAWSRYLRCPSCEKRHDPRNRVLQMGYQRAGYWQVDAC